MIYFLSWSHLGSPTSAHRYLCSTLWFLSLNWMSHVGKAKACLTNPLVSLQFCGFPWKSDTVNAKLSCSVLSSSHDLCRSGPHVGSAKNPSIFRLDQVCCTDGSRECSSKKDMVGTSTLTSIPRALRNDHQTILAFFANITTISTQQSVVKWSSLKVQAFRGGGMCGGESKLLSSFGSSLLSFLLTSTGSKSLERQALALSSRAVLFCFGIALFCKILTLGISTKNRAGLCRYSARWKNLRRLPSTPSCVLCNANNKCVVYHL